MERNGYRDSAGWWIKKVKDGRNAMKCVSIALNIASIILTIFIIVDILASYKRKKSKCK